MSDIEVIERRRRRRRSRRSTRSSTCAAPPSSPRTMCPARSACRCSNDAERAEVGTIYVQESRFRARRIGAALIARNVARHLETRAGGQARRVSAADLLLARRPALGRHGDHPLAGRLAHGGARRRLQDLPPPRAAPALRRATGRCGWCCSRAAPAPARPRSSARLAARGVQTLDLEALAEHRGSVFGGLSAAAAQPEDVRVPAAGGARGSRPRAPDRGRGRGQQGRRPHDRRRRSGGR